MVMAKKPGRGPGPHVNKQVGRSAASVEPARMEHLVPTTDKVHPWVRA